jgi:hypothetical protein
MRLGWKVIYRKNENRREDWPFLWAALMATALTVSSASEEAATGAGGDQSSTGIATRDSDCSGGGGGDAGCTATSGGGAGAAGVGISLRARRTAGAGILRLGGKGSETGKGASLPGGGM